MFKRSKRFYLVFFWMMLSSSLDLLFYSITAVFLSDQGASLYWMNFVIPVAAFAAVYFYSMEKIPVSLQALLGLVTTLALTFGSKYFILYILKPSGYLVPQDLTLLITSGALCAVMLYIGCRVQIGFDRVYQYLDAEKKFETKEAYMAWFLKEIGDDSAKLQPSWFISQSTALGCLLIIAGFMGAVMRAQTVFLLSIYLVVFVLGALGVYLIVFQFSSIIQWKLKGFVIKTDTLRNWNKLILYLMVPLAVIPLFIPWNFSIVNSQFIGNTLLKWVSTMNLKVYTEGADTNSMIGNQAIQGGVTNVPVAMGMDKVMTGMTRTLVYIIAGLIAIYIALALIGGLLLLVIGKKRKPGWAMFFINRFYTFKGMLGVIGGFFLFLSGIAVIFRRKKKASQQDQSKLEKQLYSYFEADKELSSEKKDEIRAIIKSFIKFIDTANRTVTPYYFFYGPLEYTKKVIVSRPHLEKELKLIVAVFNESRYSLHLLSEEKKDEFNAVIDFVIVEIERA